MYDLLFRLFKHLSRQKKIQFFLLFVLMFFGSILEVVSLGSILPLLSAFTDINSIKGYPLISDILLYFNLTTTKQTVLFLTVFFIIAALISGITRLSLLFLGTNLSFLTGHELSVDLFRRTLSQPYETHISRNSSEIIGGITTKVSNVTMVLQKLVLLLHSFLLIIIVSVALILLNPKFALLPAVSFIIFYAIVIWFFRGKLNMNSRHVSTETTKIIKIVQESMNGIKDIILNNLQYLHSSTFLKHDLKLKKAQSSNVFISGSPRYLMETFSMVLFAIIAFLLFMSNDGIAGALPILGALAIGAQRLLPAAQQCFSSWSSIIGSKNVLMDILELLDQSELVVSLENDPKKLDFKNSIELNDVSLKYKANENETLSNINIRIEKGKKIAFVGSTGSGKSTAVDLIMGLLKPTVGNITIDGKILKDKYIRNWQNSISHVPQNVFLSDTTIAENIALNNNNNIKDLKLLENVLLKAQLFNFIEGKSKKYNTNVGEAGISLSGGQVQRIGIARALFKKGNILVLDEATSALDSITEKRLLEAICEKNKNLTIIIITHKLSIIKDCDYIYEFDKGKLVSQGTYKELLKSSMTFKKMSKNN